MVATGNNRQAAIVAGINTKRVKCIAYVYSGILASVTGAVLTARLQSGQTTCGNGFELDAIAGAIIGGASLGGGGGSIAGTICGILFIYVVKNGMQLLGVNTYWQNTVQGLILILAVLIDVLRKHINKK
jgi:ribose transport system permease protein